MLLRFCQTDGFSLMARISKNSISQGRKGYLVLSHAPLLSEEGAGGALLLTVAVVEHWNQTRVLAERQWRS